MAHDPNESLTGDEFPILEDAPEEEGDNSEAGGGKPVDSVSADEIEDAPEQEDDEDADSDSA